jgi:ABC-type sugar transport system permease subunit
VFLVVTSSIAYLRIFDYVYAMTNGQGGPLDATKPLVLKIFETAFTHFEMGYAATQTVVLFAILLVDLARAAQAVAQPMSPKSHAQSGAGRDRHLDAAVLGGIVMVIPFAYMLGASFKLNNEIYELSLLPREPTLDNYRRLFERSGFPRWFGNSLLVGTVTTARCCSSTAWSATRWPSSGFAGAISCSSRS